MHKKRALSILLVALLILTLSQARFVFAGANTQALPTSANVLVNDNKVAFEAYNIKGNNYFKLRDLAMALNGSSKQFEVTWDGTKNAISLLTNHSYTPAGGELSVSGNLSTKTASLTTAKIYIDGKEALLTAYNINGNNYFKLRDVGSSLDFGVAWDGSANTISIDTVLKYTAGAFIVRLAGFKFVPEVMTINKGETVIWKNTDSAGHDVTGENFVSKTLNKGDTFSFTFNEAGTFDYSCTFHSGMNGQIVVK